MSCPDCFTGHIHTQTPTGTVTTLHGIPTYVASPEAGVTPKGIIVMITDAFGWEFENNRVLCDQYAKKGNFIVYCPDFMMGTPPSSNKFYTFTDGYQAMQ
jgi:dienelactone hydrolase